MSDLCECCGGPLASFEGESFCPECTRWETVVLAEEADDEARGERMQPAPAQEEGPADGPPW